MAGRLRRGKLPFDREGGTLVIQLRLRTSNNWETLSAQAKVLLDLLQIHWRNEKPVAYGIREASRKIPCCKTKAIEAFKELESRGFIVKIDESLFNSRTGSKSRTWRLTWLPYKDRPPTNDWENH